MTWMMRSRSSSRLVYRSAKSICLPTVFSASENFALKSSWSVFWSLARAVPMACATRITSSTVLLTRTKNEIRMSARMLSRQIRPSRPVRVMSIVFTEMSMTSALCSTGRTTCPVNVTSTFRILETINALPCSTLRNKRVTVSNRTMTMSRTAATDTPMPKVMASMVKSSGFSGASMPRERVERAGGGVVFRVGDGVSRGRHAGGRGPATPRRARPRRIRRRRRTRTAARCFRP